MRFAAAGSGPARPAAAGVLSTPVAVRVALALAGVVGVALAGCAETAPRSPPDPRVATVRLVHGGDGPEVQRLLATIYAPDFSPAAGRDLARAALAKYPDSGLAHEAAGYLALLAIEPHELWFHFWKAAQDLDAPLTDLYLWEMSANATRAELDANLQLFEAIRTQHPSPAARGAATVWQARTLAWLGRTREARAIAAGRGYLRDWQILGPLDNEDGKGFLTVFPPERSIDLAQMVPGTRVPVSWRQLPDVSDVGNVMLGHFVWPRDPALAYLATWVHADAAVAQASLRISTSAPTRVWINGGLVLSDEHVGSGDEDNLIIPVKLNQGWNQVLIKSAQTNQDWWLRARFTNDAGDALPGLVSSAQAHPFRPATDADAGTDAVEITPRALLDLPSGTRRSFLDARWQRARGDDRRELTALQPSLDASPDNPLVTFAASLAYSDNDEVGKSLDLVNRGIDRLGDTAPVLFAVRGNYYLQRQLYDKAQADQLRAMAAAPRARGIEQGLAHLFGRRGWTLDQCLQLEATARKWPDHAGVLIDLGTCEIRRGQVAQGIRALEQAVAIEPGNSDAIEELYGRATTERRFADAHLWLRKLREISPTSPMYHNWAADLAEREGHLAESEAELRAALELCPTWAEPHSDLGDLLWRLGRQQEAVAEWKLASARDPNDSVLAQRLEFHAPTRLGFVERYVPTGEDIDRALRQKLTPDPGAPMAFLLDHEVTEVNADGSARRVITTIAQALNEHGRDELIARRLPSVGPLKILQAYALSKDGQRQEASSIRSGEIRFRGLDVGSRVVLQYVHYAPSGHFLENHFVTNWYFRTASASEQQARWILVMPKDRSLRVHVEGPVKLEETVIGDRRVRSWSAPPASALIPEAHGPPLDDVLWRVSVSTVPDWDEYVRWERALLADAFQSSPRLDALAARLTTGATSARDKLDRLYRYVTTEIRYQQDYENTVAGVRPHACPVVIERGYGDCKDKAVLLIQLARLVGVKLQFAILRTTQMGRVMTDVPNQQFNHAIVYAPAQPGIDAPIFLDPTSDGLDLGNLPTTDQGATSLALDPQSGSWKMIEIPYQPIDVDYARLSFRLDVASASEAHIAAEIVARGTRAQILRHVLRNRSVADRTLQSYVGTLVPGSKLVGSAWPPEDTDRPLDVTMDVDAAHALRADDDRLRFPIPNGMPLSAVALLDRRETALVLGPSTESSQTVTVNLPKGYAFDRMPRGFSVANPCFTLRREVTPTGGARVTITDDVRFTCHEIAATNYPAFRDQVRDAITRLRDEVSFAPAASAGAAASAKPAAGAKPKRTPPPQPSR